MAIKVLLYSGGMDSYIISKLEKPCRKVYFDLKGAYSEAEIANLPKDVDVLPCDLSLFERNDDFIIPMRNLVLVALASTMGDRIILGATAGDRVLDKSFEFAEKASDILTFLWKPQHWTVGKEVEVLLPYKNKTKNQMVREYLDRGFSVQQLKDESFSCYTPVDGKECFSCKPCLRKWSSLSSFGAKYSTEENACIADYFKKNRHVFLDRADEYKSIMKSIEKIGMS